MPRTDKPAANETSGIEPLNVGAAVRVTLLGKNGVVSKLLSNGRCKVTVGTLSIICESSELTKVDSRHHFLPVRTQIKIPKFDPPPATLDLHGDTVEEAMSSPPILYQPSLEVSP